MHAQATVDRSSIPSVVNTQLLNPLTQQGDPSAKVGTPDLPIYTVNARAGA
jgi:hypothetical protein